MSNPFMIPRSYSNKKNSRRKTNINGKDKKNNKATVKFFLGKGLLTQHLLIW